MPAISHTDKAILRELAKKVAEIAALPQMEDTKRLWRKLNALEPERPMITADQIPWNEMDIDGGLILTCENGECRAYEQELRKTIYRHKYIHDDTVAEPFVNVYKAIGGAWFVAAIGTKAETIATDPDNATLSYRFENQITCMDDIEKIKMPTVHHNEAETARRLEFAHEIFDGAIGIRETGHDPSYMTVWDPISMWMGMENALYAMIDTPELIHALVKRAVDFQMSMLDQAEEQGLLCGPQPIIHCGGAWSDDLDEGYDPAKPRTKDLWMFSMAQMLGPCSPAMFREFEIEPCMPLFERFGMVYYGCCEPLDRMIESVKKIPNLRKISVSPWADEEKMAEAIGGRWVYSRKTNPALLAFDSFDESAIRADLTRTKAICEKYGCPLEFIQKDISTVKNDPRRLSAWARIAREAAEA